MDTCLESLHHLEECSKSAHEIVDNLFLGNVEAALDPVWLENAQVTRVISILSECPDYSSSKFRSLHINHKFFDADDVSEQKIANYFPECVTFIQDAIDSEENILVHCRQGVSRSCTVVCAYLMSINPDWTPMETVSFVRKSREIVEPNEGFMFQLEVWKANSYIFNDQYNLLFDEMKQASLTKFEDIILEIDSLLIPGYKPSKEIRERFEGLCFDLWAHPYQSSKLSELRGDIIEKFPKWSTYGLRVNDFVYIHSLSGFADIIVFEESMASDLQ